MKNWQQRLSKKILFSILTASVLSVGVMGSVGAEGSIILSENKTITGNDFVINASDDGASNPLGTGEGANRSYGLAVVDGNDYTLTVDEEHSIHINNTINGTDRNYGIALENNSDLTIKGDIDINVEGYNTQARAIRNNSNGLLTIDGNLNINAKSENSTNVAIDAFYGADIIVNGDTQIDMESKNGNVYCINSKPDNGGSIIFNGNVYISILDLDGTGGDFETINLNKSRVEFNGNTDISIVTDKANAYIDGVCIMCDDTDQFTTETNFKGQKTNIKIESSGDNSAVYGVMTSGGKGSTNFLGKEVNILLESNADVLGLYSQYKGNITSAENTILNIKTVSKEAAALGIHISGYSAYNGNINLSGDVNIISKAKAEAYGMFNSATEVDPDGLTVLDSNDGKLVVQGKVSLNIESQNAVAYGVISQGKYADTVLNNDVAIKTDGTNGSVATCAIEAGSISLGSAGKTVSLTGDVLADNGTITLQGSDNTINGVITSKNSGEVNLNGEAATYNLQHMEADGGTINVGAGTTIVVDSANVTGDNYLVTISDADNLVVGDNAKIKITNAKKNTEYNIVDGSKDGYWDLQDISTDNFMLECVKKDGIDDYILTTQVADARKAFGGAVLIPDVLTQTMKKKDAGDAAFDFFSAAADSKVNATTEQAAKAINNAATMSELAGVSHATYSASNILTDAVDDHMSLAKNLDHDTDIWAHYVHNKENIDGLATGNSGARYDAQYNGIVVGADLYKRGKGTLGAALTYIDGKITGNTRNEAEYYGLSIYGGIENEDSAVIGDISYLHGKNDITQNNSGYTLTGEPKSDALSVGVRAEQSFKAGAGKVVPYAGLRYMHLGTGNYTNSIGLQYDADDANLFLLPVGVKYSAEHKTAGWTLRPIVEVGYVWAMGDRDGQQTVSLNGASNGFGYDVTDSGSYIGRFALEAEKANVTYGLGYEYQKGDSVKANKWMVNLNWAF